MTMTGADVDALEALARTMSDASRQLGEARAHLGSRISSTNWVGPDGEQFRADWSSSHARSLQTVQHALESLSSTLVREAQQQREASATDGSGGPASRSGGFSGGGGGGGGGGGWSDGGEDPLSALDRWSQQNLGFNPLNLPWMVDSVMELAGRGLGDFMQGMPWANHAFEGAGAILDGMELGVDAFTAYESWQQPGDHTTAWFDTFDAAGDAVGMTPGLVGTLGKLIIKDAVDTARIAVDMDWSYPLPPLNGETLTSIYLPGIGQGFTDTFKMVLGNL